jgi:DNA-binding CsgD family transcriptional regulator
MLFQGSPVTVRCNMSSTPEQPEEDRGARALDSETLEALELTLPARTPLASAEDLAKAIDTLVYPMLALQPDGLLLHANHAARELLEAGQPLVLGPDQRVGPRAAQHRSQFSLALQAASAGQAQYLHWADGPQALHAALRPLDVSQAGAPPPPVLMMLAPPPETEFDASAFALRYKLSAAEARVLEALMHGFKAEEVAERLGVGVATVRTQIAAIRRKTGHNSVAGLLATLGELPPLRKPAAR